MSIDIYLENGGCPEDLPKSTMTEDESMERDEQIEQDREELAEDKELDRIYSNNYE